LQEPTAGWIFLAFFRSSSMTDFSDNRRSGEQPQGTKTDEMSSARASGSGERTEESPADCDRTRYGPSPSRESQTFGDYELLEEIARGGMGVVFKARQISLNRRVALKMILEGQLASDAAVQRFYLEARAAASLDHPNIVPIYEIGQCEGRHFFTMAFVEGSTLSALVRQNGVPPPAEAAALVLAVADAVAFAHQHGVIHRDLKPDNVLVDRSGRPRVTDFGLAKCLGGDSGLTHTGQVMGTPSYMAPEQALGQLDRMGPATDVYAVGGILYFLLTGRAPFEGQSAMQVLSQVTQRPPLPPSKHVPSVPAALEAICLKCLEKEPANRYASAKELAAALRASGVASLPSLGSAGPPPGPVQQTLPSPDLVPTNHQSSTLATPPPPGFAARRRRGMLAALAVVALAGILGGGWFLLKDRGGTGSEAVDPSKDVLVQPTRHDFNLKVELVGSTAGKEGERLLYVPRDEARRKSATFKIVTEIDAYVGLWNVGPDGTIAQLFPNKFDRDHLCKAEKARLVPPNRTYEFTPEVTGKTERIWIVASSKYWDPNQIQGEEGGKYTLFRIPEHRDNLKRSLRGFRIKPASGHDGPLVTEEVLPYRIAVSGP
jgi:serine/threonine protein kinase